MRWLTIATIWLSSFAYGSTPTLDSARALLKAGQVVEALRQLRELEKQSPNDPNLQFEIGELLQELAASRAQRLQKLAPDSAEIHELLGKSFESHQKTEEAASEYKLAAQANPQLPGIHFLIANLYYKQRDFDAARPALEAELHLNANHALANLRMGEILLATDAQAPQKAIGYLRKAIADSRIGLEAHRELGKALRLAGQYSESLRELDLVARQQPEDEFVHAQLAALYRDMGDPIRARQEMEMQKQILDRKREASLKARQGETPAN